MKKAEIQEIKKTLLTQKEETVKSIQSILEDAKILEETGKDMDSFDQSVNLNEMERLKNLKAQKEVTLRGIETALARVDSKNFGLCISCEDEIPLKRLQKNPLSVRCLGCQEDLEMDQKNKRNVRGISAEMNGSGSSEGDDDE